MKERNLFKKGVELKLVMAGKNKKWLKEQLGFKNQQHLSNILRGVIVGSEPYRQIAEALKTTEEDILKMGRKVERSAKKFDRD